LSLKSKRNSLDLDFTGVFEAALSDGALELVLEEKLIPASKVSTLVLLIEVFLGLLLLGTLILRHNLSHLSTFKSILSNQHRIIFKIT